MQILLATQNKNKIKEMSQLLGSSFSFLSLADVNFHDEIPETETTIEANSLQKAKFVFDRFALPCIADDTGLEVEALQGAPGVYSARYAGPQKNDTDNIALLLRNLQNTSNRKARFKTIITYVEKDGIYRFEGIVNGSILPQQKGSGGFGYDPVFQPDGFTESFAEMTLEEKNKISHRAIALHKLIDFLKEKYP